MPHRVRSFKNTRKKRKYGNIPEDYKGNKYHSRFEAKYARDLDVRKRAGEIESWERQVKIELTAHGKHICDYWIDFKVYYPNGEVEYVEVKGVETPVWRLKWKLFCAQMETIEPDARLTIVR
jgi:hypothetical protein